MSVTFEVSQVERAEKPLKQLDAPAALRSMLRKPVEALSEPARPLVSCTDTNPLAEAASHAFYGHYPLVLSPDAVWLCLAQGFATHVALHAEALRGRFVRHEGKAKLVVERRDFLLGQPNPWPEVFAAFADQVAGHVGKLRDLVAGDFSTTGPTERAAFDVVVMDTFQPYFEYEMRCGCGIPSVTLRGTPADWRSVRTRAAALGEYGLEAWTQALLPVLDKVVDTAEGRPDREFWRSFFRYQSGSGPSELTGWLQVLFPYLKLYDRESCEFHLRPNPYLADWEAAWRHAEARTDWRIKEVRGPPLSAIPAGLSSAPVNFVDVRDGSTTSLRFVAGLVGVVQDAQTWAVEPEFGWAVVHDG